MMGGCDFFDQGVGPNSLANRFLEIILGVTPPPFKPKAQRP